MVARITTSHRISDALNYNEQKVKKGTAECIDAGNYLADTSQLNFYQKLAGFETRNNLNDRATTKTLHISLNFDPSEKLAKDKLVQIAETYMAKIGFTDQPYLVYQHQDAGHPHIHIVTTTIRADGSRINTHNIGRNQSEKARKEIELHFNLVRAEKQTQLLKHSIRPVDPQKINYGKDETKRSISNAVNAVINQYRFTSLPEFNAALRQFNVIADRGSEEGRIYKTGGLIYRVLDENGKKIGVPIKASSIITKPTLAKQQIKFSENVSLREPHKQLLKNIINKVLQQQPSTISHLKQLLEKERVFTLVRQNTEGRAYGITFVDNISKCVFNGSDLGKDYSITGLLKLIVSTGKEYQHNPDTITEILAKEKSKGKSKELITEKQIQQSIQLASDKNYLTDQLLDSKTTTENVPFQLRKKRKRKKKRNPEL